MLGSSILLLLFAANGHGAAIRRQDGPSPEVRKALEDAGVDVNKRSVTPKNKVEQLLSIGDSYSAGIGANGAPDEWGHTNCSRYAGAWPVLLRHKDEWKDLGKDGNQPSLTFGACSGNIMVDVRDKMLEQGDAKDTLKLGSKDSPYTPIGKPQIAVMTISGNDVKFSGIVNDCVFRYWPKKSCDDRLADSKRILESPEFKQELRLTYAKVIAAGRQAGGADPPESFQLYGGGYVGLFNPDDVDCDKIYWNADHGWISHYQYLTTDLRRKFNDLVNGLNGVIKSVAEELAPWGVIYVDGYDQGFNDHRFCEKRDPKCIHEISHQDNDVDTKIWSYQSPWDEGRKNNPLNDGEGKNRADICTKNAENEAEMDSVAPDTDIFENIADLLVPNPEERQKLRDDKTLTPWNVSTNGWNFDAYDDVFDMMRDRMNLHDDPASVKWKYDWTYRMFHPKKSGYQFFANSWMERIKANRQQENVYKANCFHTSGPAPEGFSTFQRGIAKEAAKKFCSNEGYFGKVVVPQIAMGTGQTPKGKGKAVGFSDTALSSDGLTEVTAGLWFSEDSCMGSFTWGPTPITTPEQVTKDCLLRFDAIIDGCDAGTPDGTFGGTTADVCAIYKVGARPKGENPFPLKTQGAIKCEDTKLPEGIPPINACTCWYENIPGNTEEFPKPAGGCGSYTRAPAWTYLEDPDPSHSCNDPDPEKCKPKQVCTDPKDPSTCKPIKR